MVWRVLTRDEIERTKQHFASQGYVAQWHAMAMEVILTTLGDVWWKKNCISGAIKPDEFLAFAGDSEDARYSYQDRIVKLGHMLYALKECAGYDAFILALKTRDLAPAFFELWVANVLYNNSYSVEFVVARGSKGEDYDLTARKHGVTLSVEAKSRRGGITLGETNLLHTLEKARKQLPSLGPGVIFISIPNEWTMKIGTEAIVNKSIDSFFNRSARVNYVVLIWHQWNMAHGARVSTSYFREYENAASRTPVKLRPIISPVELPSTLISLPQSFTPSFW